MTKKARERYKDVLIAAVDNYADSMESKDFAKAIEAADFIRNIGLHFGSECWNRSLK